MSGPAPITQADNAFVLNDPNLERTFRGHKNYVTSVAFSPSMKQLASGAGDDTVFLWSFKPQLRAFRFMGHRGVVTDVCFSPEGDVLASASKDRTVRLWVPSAKGESVTMKGHTGAVRSVKFSADSKYLVTASDDKTAKVWAMPSRKFAASLVGHSNWVRSAAFDCTSKLVVTGSDDTTVKLWDVSSPNPLHTFTDHNDAVLSSTFSTVRALRVLPFLKGSMPGSCPPSPSLSDLLRHTTGRELRGLRQRRLHVEDVGHPVPPAGAALQRARRGGVERVRPPQRLLPAVVVA